MPSHAFARGVGARASPHVSVFLTLKHTNFLRAY